MVRKGHINNKSRQSQHVQSAVVVEGNIVERMRPGRHSCRCQARIHDLIRNCMGCGKIVCAQEGSGPCLFCGTLVCTKEEREILERGSRKSAELYKKLTGEELPEKGAFSSATDENDLTKAVDFRNKLLTADADTEHRTKVHDLQSDYSNVENNAYLTKEEREDIIRRREELHRIREERRKVMVVSIDLESRTATNEEQNLTETDPAYDPVIRAILDRSETRKNAASASDNAIDARWVPKGFVPKYANEGPSICNHAEFNDVVDSACLANEELAALEMERQAYSIALPQPAAALLASGRIKCIRWKEDLHLKGPLFICANTQPVSGNEIEEFNKKYVKGNFHLPLDYSSGTLQGRAYLADILTLQEYKEEIGNIPLFGSGDFVLAFNSFEPLTIPVPHIPPSDFFQLEKVLRDALSHVFAR